MADVAASSALSGAAQGASAGAVFGVPGMIIGGAVGAIAGFFSGSSSEDAQERLIRAQIKAERTSLGETLRRFDLETGVLAGTVTTRAAAAGVDVGVGSPMEVLLDVENERNRERQYLEQQSLARQQVIRAGGQAAASEQQAALLGQAFESGMTAFGLYQEYGKKTKTTAPRIGPPD